MTDKEKPNSQSYEEPQENMQKTSTSRFGNRSIKPIP